MTYTSAASAINLNIGDRVMLVVVLTTNTPATRTGTIYMAGTAHPSNILTPISSQNGSGSGTQGYQGNQGSGIAAGSSGQLEYNSSGAFAGAQALTYASSGNLLTAAAQLATDTPLTVKGQTSQTGNLMGIQSSAGTNLSTFDANGLGFVHLVTFALPGTQIVATNLTNSVIIPRVGKIIKAYAAAQTSPTGAALIFDILQNGTSIWASDTGDRISIAAGQTYGTSSTFTSSPVTVAEGDLFTINCVQVGSTVPGAIVTVTLLLLLRNN